MPNKDAQENQASEWGKQGGKARAQKLSPEDRKAIAQQAADARWGGIIPRSDFMGTLTIAGKEIICAVLPNGERVLTQESFLQAIGRSIRPKAGTGITKTVDGMPSFLAADNLQPFIGEDLRRSTTPLCFRLKTGQKAYGFPASMLPMVCNVYLKARDEKKLLHNQVHIATACDLLLRGLAEVGIIGLVDEATGYQKVRARDELNRILEAYIATELMKWAKRFPDEFYQEMFRLWGWQYQPLTKQGPRYAGKLTNELVYKRLPPGVLDELRKVNPQSEKGYRRYSHHQFLTDDIGNPHLEKHISHTMMLMRVSDSKAQFLKLMNKAFPLPNTQLEMELDDDQEEESV